MKNLTDIDDIDELRDYAKQFHLVIQYKTRFYNVYRLQNHRAIFQGKRYTLKELKKYIRALVSTVDYDNSKCAG